MQTLSDLAAYCRRQARIELANYVDPWARDDRRAEGLALWRVDRRTRDVARAACFRAFPGRLRTGTEPLQPGRYGRLTIEPDGSPDYTSGQYAAVEIYNYLLQYLRETN